MTERMKRVKNKFKLASAKAVSDEGWKKLFARYDDDGSGACLRIVRAALKRWHVGQIRQG